MLVLVGLGLFDEKDLTIKGIEEAKSADEVYVELYTSKWHGSLEKIEKMVGKKVELLSRKDLEEESKKILEKAIEKNIVILVPGDPLVATVHSALIQEARKLGIETKIIHNASILSAIGEVGLHIYKFGPSVTIPFPEKTKGKIPESVYEVIKENKERGLHTLCFLDLIAEENRFMSIAEALNYLLILEKNRKEDVISENSLIVGISRLGSESRIIKFGRLKDLIKVDFGRPPYCIILVGKLHFTEKEFLEFLN